MNILGIETATERLSVALLVDGTEYERHTDARSSHCELINGFVTELLAEGNIDIDQLDSIAASIGPGSFTGLRIGIASAMGIAYAIEKPVSGINTLMGLAFNVGFHGALVCPLIDARRSEAYTALYRLENGIPGEIMAPTTIPVPELGKMLKEQNERVTITGPGLFTFRDLLEISHADLIFADTLESKPSAVSIARIGEIMYEAGQSVAPSELKPLYLRRSDAELLRDKQCRQS